MMLFSTPSAVSTVAHLTSHSLLPLSRRAEEVITKVDEASVGAGSAARCCSTLYTVQISEVDRLFIICRFRLKRC